MKTGFFDPNKTIHLCHNGNQKIIYMYEPFTKTIFDGFKSLNSSIVIKEQYGRIDFEKIQDGSIFIFVGNYHEGQTFRVIPWEALHKKNVYTIYFQTEPRSNLNLSYEFIDEMWDYGHHNIDRYDTHSLFFPHIRYIPAGVNLKKKHMIQSDICDKLIFLGGVYDNRLSFKRFIDSSPILRKAFISINNIWDENSFSKLLENTKGIFLNFHKFESEFSQISKHFNKPVAPRISKLLNSKCLIISTRCYEKDEEEYKDMVSFCNNDEIEAEFLRLSRMTKEERQLLADTRYDLFKSRFCPSKIFENEKIKEMFMS